MPRRHTPTFRWVSLALGAASFVFFPTFIFGLYYGWKALKRHRRAWPAWLGIVLSLLGPPVEIGVGYWLWGGLQALSPKPFWQEFETLALKKKEIREGKRGGCRAYHWESDKPNAFTAEAAVQFAVAHKWTLVRQERFPGHEVNQWLSINHKPVFPLTYDGFQPSTAAGSILPRWIEMNLDALVFDTGWSATIGDERKRMYGVVIISQDGRQMSAYQLWAPG